MYWYYLSTGTVPVLIRYHLHIYWYLYMSSVHPTLSAKERHILNTLESCKPERCTATSSYHAAKVAHTVLDPDHRSKPILISKRNVRANKCSCRAANRHAQRGVRLEVRI